MLTFTHACLSLVIALVTNADVGGRAGSFVLDQQPVQDTASFRIVRIAAGPRGSEVGGHYRLDEERTTFNRSTDAQVIVYFQWEGAPGLHRFSGRWRAPGGGLSATSEFEYPAANRLFGAYWVLPLSTSTPTGTWSIDATVDGLPSGSLTFEIVDSATSPAPLRRRPLSPAELYERANGAFAAIERSVGRDGKTERAGGVLLSRGRILTTFGAVDAADGLHTITADGRRQEVTALLGWNRNNDWALIATPSEPSVAVPVAAAEDVKVGDRCYAIGWGTGDTRALAECNLVGRGRSTPAGAGRLLAAFFTIAGARGGPVFNEFGEIIGVLGGALMPSPLTVSELAQGPGGVPIVPLSLVPSEEAEPVSIQELKRRNVLIAAVNGGENILSGGFAREIQRSPVRAIDQREEFSSRDRSFYVFLTWDPKTRLRGTVTLRVYDDNNALVTQSKPGKVDFRPGTIPFSRWQLPVPSRVGVYRVDVVFGEIPIWRGYVRVTG